MDVDDVPAAKGSRPDRLFDVSGPQERVLQPPMGQLVESVPVAALLDIPVPQMMDQLVDVLKIIDTTSSVEQVIKVPMIAFQDGVPPRRASRAAAGGTVGGGARALL